MQVRAGTAVGGAGAPTLPAYPAAGGDVEARAARLQDEGADSFAKSWAELLATIARQHEAIA